MSFTSQPISTDGVYGAAPMEVYQSERFGPSTYVIPELLPGGLYRVRLHFAEIYWGAPGQRRFKVIGEDLGVLLDLESKRAVYRNLPDSAVVLQVQRASRLGLERALA